MATYPYLGDITILGFDFPPKGWAACDGQLLSIDQYTELYSLLSTTFGGDGRTNFGLPDLRGRVPIDFGQGLGLTDRTLGKQLGEDTVTLTGDQIPAHTHQLNASTDPATATEPGGNLPATVAPGFDVYRDDTVTDHGNPAQVVANSGVGKPHNNLQPYLTLNFVIAVIGEFPPRS